MATLKKDLRHGTPLWVTYPKPRIPSERLKGDEKTDILIIGAGITGAMLAEELTSLGLSVIIIDRRGPLLGATSATTALLQYEIDQPLIHLKKQIGHDNAMRALRRSKLALESLSAKIQTLDVKCAFNRKSSLYLAGNVLDADKLKEEQQAKKDIGIFSEYMNRSALAEQYGIKRSAALRSFDNISTDPRCLAAAFLKAALARNARLFTPHDITEIETGNNEVIAQTKDGFTIRAGHLVFATGYEMPKYIHTRKHKINSTWAIATKAQKSKLWPQQSFIWEASDPYLYARCTSDGRVICGGEDEEFSDEEKRNRLLPGKTRRLEKKLAELFPQLDTGAEFAWTASFGGSTTGLPSIGKVPGMKNCYAILAYGGNGITFSRLGAELISAEIQGRADPEKDIFRL